MPEKKVLPPAVYLAYLLILSLVLTGVTFSGYITSASGKDGARVAKFEIVTEQKLYETSIEADLIPGETKDVSLQIQNKSEVAVKCRILAANLTGNLPVDVCFVVGETEYPSGVEGGFALDPNSENTEYRLRVKWNGSADPQFAGMIDHISLQLHVEQID